MQKSDYEWFLENYSLLYKKYGECYLVIKNKAVIGKYNSYAVAIEETKKREEMGTFIVQKCNSSESGYTNYIISNFVVLN